MSLSAAAALLLLSGASPPAADTSSTEIERPRINDAPAPPEPPIVVPTITPLAYPPPAAPAGINDEPPA